jgi:HEAT repeat protein
MTDAATIASKLQRSLGDEDDASVVEELQRAPNAKEILEELAKSPDLEGRGWVPTAARRVLGDAGEPLIRQMTDDPDPDVRGIAVDALASLDRRHLTSLIPSLRQRLESSDDSEVISTAWRLVRLGDVDAVDQIEEFRERFDPSWWQYKAATVIVLALRTPQEVPSQIRAHDHDHMPWLSYAATLIDVPGAMAAVEDCKTSSPDEDCRRACAHAIDLHKDDS